LNSDVIGARALTAMKNALTIDFEDWYQGLEIPLSHWDRFEDRMERSGARLLKLLERAGARATFFILGYVAERHPELIRQIASAGHEIGVHGYSHSFIYKQTPDEFRSEMERTIKVLEDITGRKVISSRAPFFSITRQSLWALEVLAGLGIKYDSSIFPAHNYRYGIADAPRWPYKIACGQWTIFEFPISTWRALGQNLPVAGGAYFRIYPYRFTRFALRAINRSGHPFVFYLHPWELDPDHPRLRLPKRIAFTHYFNLRATERRFLRLLGDFQFAPMSEALRPLIAGS
jgi:polysaccharide deacetylase family protein (PEP-CTERM system associated)